MKYIRTKDGKIIKILQEGIDEFGKYGLVDEENCIRNYDDLKQADTIEELIDVYVYYLKSGGAFIDGELANKFDIYESVYGAIWTDKCLLYVAKVNKKGKLELL